MRSDILFIVGTILIFVGFLLIFLGSIREIDESSGGFIILIGPIPIVGSWGSYGGLLTIILLLITLIILFSIFLHKEFFVKKSGT